MYQMNAEFAKACYRRCHPRNDQSRKQIIHQRCKIWRLSKNYRYISEEANDFFLGNVGPTLVR